MAEETTTQEEFDIDALIAELSDNDSAYDVETVDGAASEAKSKSGV